MRKKYTLIISIVIMLFGCKNNELVLGIQMGITESDVKKEIKKLVSKNELEIIVGKYNDTSYFKEFNFNGKKLKAKVNFNNDILGSGPLRNYTYEFAVNNITETGNDSTNSEGKNQFYYTKFIRIDDFNYIRSELEKKYGKPSLNIDDTYSNYVDTSYIFDTKNELIYFHNGINPIVLENEKYQYKFPVYIGAHIEVKSRNYEIGFNKEKEERKKTLKPEDILSIYFEDATLKSNDSYFNNDSESAISIVAKNETYKTYVIDDAILECKGKLSFLDSYNDTIHTEELNYIFNSPLESPKKGLWRYMNYNAYTLNQDNPAYFKIRNILNSNSKVKITFKPTAIVLANGDVIK